MASTSLIETRNDIHFIKSEKYYEENESFKKQVGMTTANLLPLSQANVPLNSTNGVTTLMQACQQGKDVAVRQLLHKDSTTVLYRDRTGKTALHYCAENNTLNCIEQLLNTDPSLLVARDEDGYTALHLATIAGNKAVVKYLLSKGADIHAKDNEDHTAVHWATVCGEVELLDLLIDSGADPSTPDIHGAYPIHYAAQMCGPNSELGTEVQVGRQVLQKLLQRGVSVSVRDHDGRQPLLWAASAEVRPSHVYCISGSADAILALINAGADVSAEDKDGLTALHCAASRGHLDCIDVLINFCNAEVDTMDNNGCTPLFYAVTLGHADCTEQLLNHGAIADRQDRKGRTPAHCGAAKGQLETLKLLHRRKADMWKKNIKGDLPLHEACQSGRIDLVMWLLSLQPESVNAPNNDGRCPLHIAAINNNIEMCKILLDSKATLNPIMRNSRGQLLTPVDAAVARGNRECAKYLHLHGGLPASKLTDKRALQIAMQKALEAGPVMGRTGATPSDLASGEVTESSSPNMTKTPSTTILTPTLLSPNDALHAQTGTNVLSQASVGLQMGSSSFSPHSVDSQSQTEASPQLHDAGTYTSEENMRQLLLREERILEEKLMAEENQELDNSEAVQQEGTEISGEVLGVDENTEQAGENAEDEAAEEGKFEQEDDAKNDDYSKNDAPEAEEGRGDKDKNGNIENTVEEITNNVKDKENEQLLEDNGENGNKSKNENDSESLESRTTETSSKTSEATVKSISNSKSDKKVQKKNPVIKKTASVIKQEKSLDKIEESSMAKTRDEANEDEKTESLSQGKSITAIVASKTTQKLVQGKTGATDKAKAQISKKSTVKKSISTDAESDKSKNKVTKKLDNKSRQESIANESEKGTKIEKVKRQNTKKFLDNEKDPKENKYNKTSTNKGNIKQRARSEDPSGRNVQTKNESKARSKSLDKNASKEEDSEGGASQSEEADNNSSKQGKEEKNSEIENVSGAKIKGKKVSPKKGLGQEDDSAEESGASEGSKSQSSSSSEESKSSAEKTSSKQVKKTKSKLSVPERELGDGASEDGDAAGASGDEESDTKSSKSKVSTKKRRVIRKKSSKSKHSQIIEENDADRSACESGSSSPSSEGENEGEEKDNAQPKTVKVKRLSRPRTAVISTSNPKLIPKERLIVAESDSLYSNDERTHELLLMSSGRETGLVREAPSDINLSPSRLSIQDQQNFKKKVAEVDSVNHSESRSSSSSSSDEESKSKDSSRKSKRKLRKNKNEIGNESDKTIFENGKVNFDSNKNLNEGNDSYGPSEIQSLQSNKRLTKRFNGESFKKGSEDEEMSQSGSDEEMDTNDPRKKEIRIARSKRRKMKLLRASESKTTKEINRAKDKKEVGKRVMSGGPRKVETMDLSLKKQKSPPTEMSITRAMQTTMRKYALERRLFQQLLDLKRIQIRNSRANEHVLIKRLVDEYNKEGNLLGLKDYGGPYNFQSYEKYLYDQLRTLQTSQGNKIPRFKPNDDVEKLTRALRKANVPDFTQTLDDRDKNVQNCNHTTHRCHHAIHAYTGVPCAAYLAQYNRNLKAGKINLPRIAPLPVRAEETDRKSCIRTYDPRKPLKVELQHGSAKQQISLPTNFLDKSQKYQLTVSIQPSAKGSSVREELNITTETENLAKAQTSESKPSSAHSAPDTSVESTSLPAKEPRSISTEGERPLPPKQAGRSPLKQGVRPPPPKDK